MTCYAPRRYRVVVSTADHPDWPIEVTALRPAGARVVAMRHYPYRLRGALVEFDVEELRPTD